MIYAHGKEDDFLALVDELKNHLVGKLCSEYLRTGEREILDRAGYALTHTKHGYVFLGRCM